MHPNLARRHNKTRGNKQDNAKKLFDVLNKLEKARYRASKKKSEIVLR